VKLGKKISIEVEPVDKKFNFELTASAYSFSWNFDGKYYRTILENYQGYIIGVRAWRDDRTVIAEIYSSSNISKDIAETYVEDHLGLNEDLDEFYILCRRDLLLRDAIEGIHVRKIDIWYASIIAVAQQNASFRQGWTMIWRLLSRYGNRYILDNGHIVITPPDVRKVIERGETMLRDSGFGYRSRTLLEIAKILLSYGEEHLKENLRNVRGVGPYTYGLIMMLAYRDYSNPVIDRWVRGLYSAVGIDNVDEYYRRHWGRYQALATWMLTLMLDAEPLSRALERVRKGLLRPLFSGLSPLTLWKYY